MNTKPIRPEECPSCLAVVSLATQAIGNQPRRTPKPGEFCICCECGEMLRFEDGMTLRIATDDDKETLPPSILARIEHDQQLIRDGNKRI